MKTATLETDGSLTIAEDLGNNAAGIPQSRTWSIQPAQIAAHLLDDTVNAVVAPNDLVKIKTADVKRKASHQ